MQTLEWAYAVLSRLPELAGALDVPLDALHERVWPDVAPRDVLGTVVVFSAGDPSDRLGLGAGPRLGSVVPLTVRVIVAAPAYDPAAPAARAIYDRLHGAQDEAVPGGGRMATCRRLTGIAYPETTEGVQYRHLGHTFEVEID